MDRRRGSLSAHSTKRATGARENKMPFGYKTNNGLEELEVVEHNKEEQTAVIKDTLYGDTFCITLEEVEYLHKLLKGE